MHRRTRLIGLTLAALAFAGLPAGTASAATPIDPSIPTPTLVNPASCDSTPLAWENSNQFNIQVPEAGLLWNATVHFWDQDGSADATAVESGNSKGLWVGSPFKLQPGHTYSWNASTFNGTADSNPTPTCSFRYDGTSPAQPVVTNPDFPQLGQPGIPRKIAGQSTAFTLSATDDLPSGCTTTGEQDCAASGVASFEYSLDQGVPAAGAASVAADGQGHATVPLTLSNWGTHTLYVESVDAAGNVAYPMTYRFYVPWLFPSTVTFSPPQTAARGAELAVNGQLQDVGDYPSGESVQVTRTDLQYPSGHPLPPVPVAANGSFRITDTPTVGGPVSYAVSYAGDGTHDASTGQTTVQVSRTATPLTLSTDASSYGYGATAHLTVHLGVTYNLHAVSLYATPVGGTKTLIASGTVDRHGNLTAAYRLTHSTVFSATFAGDFRYATATATRTVRIPVAFTESLTGWYGTHWVGGTPYRLFHHTGRATLTVHLAPAKPRECVEFQVQRFSAGAWRGLTTTGCYPLNAAGAATWQLSLARATGATLRVRALWTASVDDPSNITTAGAWQYFAVKP